jgi:hypothetical protein
MEFSTKCLLRRTEVGNLPCTGILCKNRSASETKDMVLFEVLDNLQVHVTELRTMAFIDDENLELGRRGLELNRFDDRLDVFDLVVGGGVELGHVERTSRRDLETVDALAAGLDAVGARAVERLGEYARHRGLADAARADEQIGIGDAIGLYRVAESFDDMLLTDDIIKSHRTVFQRQCDMRSVSHGFIISKSAT